MNASPKVTVIIPNWNTERWLTGCLDGLRAQTYQDFKVLLVDGGSTDNSVALVREHYPEVELVTLSQNRGFAPTVNAGLARADSDYVALLNVDTVPQPNWLTGLVDVMDQSPPEVGSLASKMLALTNPALIDDAGDTFSWYGSARKRGLGEPATNYDQVADVLSACAGAALYRQSFFEDVGLLDENFTSYLEDIDLGLRGRLRGYRCLYVPAAEVLHQGQGAGTARSRYVYLMTRNRLMVLLKNIPLELLLKHAWTLLFGQFYFFLVYKRPFHSLAGVISLLLALPRIMRQRQAIQQDKTISNQALESMLTNELGELRLRDIIKSKLR
ncbi:MAG TPA: glycosyltransferase family 2 protein [Anaerolineae bacterium]|jgi:GT2 family glycosyltransferase